MSAATAKARRLVSFRMPEDVIDLIDRAAEATHRDRTALVTEAAARHAQDVLLDQTLIRLPDADYEAFVEALDNPPEPSPALIELLKRRPAWER